MQGSESDMIHRLVDNSPHITVMDTYRNPSRQPLEMLHPGATIEIRHVKPLTETRGIRGFKQILSWLRMLPGLAASPLLSGDAIVSFAGKDIGITLNGIVPAEIETVSTIAQYVRAGSIRALSANPDGIVIGDLLAHDLSLGMDDKLNVSASTGQIHTFKIVGIFHTGRSAYDEGQAFVVLKRVQALLDRPDRANGIIIRLADPNQARTLAARIEDRVAYKTVSWQEQSEDLMNALAIRRIIMYSVVSAVLVVAAFGIYNVISTVVMEKQRDIAILKSMGFRARDVELLFLIQGTVLGVAGCLLGLPFGGALMAVLGTIQFKFPGGSDPVFIVMDWGWGQFALAGGFALAASTLAAFLPARKAARVQPVDILRGAM